MYEIISSNSEEINGQVLDLALISNQLSDIMAIPNPFDFNYLLDIKSNQILSIFELIYDGMVNHLSIDNKIELRPYGQIIIKRCLMLMYQEYRIVGEPNKIPTLQDFNKVLKNEKENQRGLEAEIFCIIVQLIISKGIE